MKWIAVAAAAALVGCTEVAPTAPLLAPTSASRAVDLNQTTPVAFPVTNPCNGETVLLSGTQHFVLRTTEPSSGNFSYGLLLTQNLTGIGSLGNTYRAHFSFADRGSFGTPYPVIIYFSASTNIVSTKANGVTGQDFHSDFSFQLTINATGIPTVERTSSSERCNGQPT